MEDTKSLLQMVIQKIFNDRPQIIEETYKIIYLYNNGKRKKSEYETTLRNICGLMHQKLPSEILVYLLTFVDMPLDLEDGCQLPIMEKMQKTQNAQNCLVESVRPQLIDFLNANKKPAAEVVVVPAVEEIVTQKLILKTENVETKEETVEKPKSDMEELEDFDKENKNVSVSKAQTSQKFLKPPVKRRIRKRAGKNIVPEICDEPSIHAKSLLDITANYVIKNEKKLKTMYTKKFEKAWRMINSNACSEKELQQCYNTVRDLNKKRKLLRGIENDDITEELIRDAYQDIDIFLKEKHVYHLFNNDPFANLGFTI